MRKYDSCIEISLYYECNILYFTDDATIIDDIEQVETARRFMKELAADAGKYYSSDHYKYWVCHV